MSEFSFDIVSRIDKQSLTDAIDQAKREIATRFDFRNSKSSIELNDLTVVVIADDEMKRKNVIDIIQSKCAKRHVPLKAMKPGKIEQASHGTLRQVIAFEQGISVERAKKVAETIRASKLKVNARIQDEQLRVSGKSKDDLQHVMALVRGMDLDFAVQFVNYR